MRIDPFRYDENDIGQVASAEVRVLSLAGLPAQGMHVHTDGHSISSSMRTEMTAALAVVRPQTRILKMDPGCAYRQSIV